MKSCVKFAIIFHPNMYRFEEEQRQEEYLMAQRERNIQRYKEKAAAKADMLAKIK